MTLREHLDTVGYSMAELMNLIAATELMADELAAMPLSDEYLRTRRNAACGVVAALTAKGRELQLAFNQLDKVGDKQEAGQ